MSRDWLLVETLGDEPVVVAEGHRLVHLVPLSEFLRRSPHLSAIQTAVTDTVSGGTSLASITPKGKRVIRTEPVRMIDGTVHGVHVWVGPTDTEPPARPVPGPAVLNLTTGVAMDSPQSLLNKGLDPETDATLGRAFAEDLPTRKLKPTETMVLSLTVHNQPGVTHCDVWELTNPEGQPITVAFVLRTMLEPAEGGREHLVARVMNWPVAPDR